jgi:hypothetical protein
MLRCITGLPGGISDVMGESRVERLIRLRIGSLVAWYYWGNRMSRAQNVLTEAVHMLSFDCPVHSFLADSTQVHLVSLYSQ